MKYFKTISLFAALLVSVIAIGCEGPAGPAGDSLCGECHNESTELKAKILQYEQSVHATGDTYMRGASATCAPCHSSEGFRLEIAGKEVTAIQNPTPVGCRTCHNIHSNNNESDDDASTTAPVPLVGDMTNGDVYDMGKGNICANCHQSRKRDYGLVVDGGDFTISSPYWGPHYGTQANIIMGSGGFEVPGSKSYGNSVHTLVIQDGCFKCHMDDEHSHTFEAIIGTCQSCHSDLTSFDYRDIQTEIAGLLEQLQTLLVEEGLITVDNEGVIRTVKDKVTSSNKAGALYNFKMVHSEGSLGIHNTTYARALLTNSIEVFD